VIIENKIDIGNKTVFTKIIWNMEYIIFGIRVKFVSEDHGIKIKVTGTKKSKISIPPMQNVDRP